LSCGMQGLLALHECLVQPRFLVGSILLIFLVFCVVFLALFVFVLYIVYPMLPVSLYCSFLIVTSVFSLYSYCLTAPIPTTIYPGKITYIRGTILLYCNSISYSSAHGYPFGIFKLSLPLSMIWI